MSDPRPSRTAMITALMRAVHTKFDRPRIIDDPWGERLVLASERDEFAAGILASVDESRRAQLETLAPDALLHAAWRAMPVYGGVIIRTRYAEEAVAAAVRRGVRQYVIIGAGFDSFALRRPDWASELDVFEVDHAASQALKRERAGIDAAADPRLHYVAADLARESLGDALARSPYRFGEPAVMSWLGVTMYLPREANMATLRSIATFAAAGSEVVFTYLEQRAIGQPTANMQRAIAFAAAIGEPWLSGFDSRALPEELRAIGLEVIDDIGGPEMHDRYCAGRLDDFPTGKAGRIATARVMPKAC